MEKKISVIGHFAAGHQCSDGQTIKTLNFTDELLIEYGEKNVMLFDTYGGMGTLFKVPFHVFRALKNSEQVLIFPGQNGLRIYAPMLCLLRPLFCGRKLQYIVIGGWLPEFLQGRRILASVLKCFDGIFVETNNMKLKLDTQGFTNVHVLPNGKHLTPLEKGKLVYLEKRPYKLCTFSRVMKEKGIEDAVAAVRKVNEELGDIFFSLDIYGQVWDQYCDQFEKVKATFPDYIRYCGVADGSKSVELLKDYFALLFPTYYEGEGFAGTLIDAYSAGLPVIATDWRYNAELVTEDTGFLYPTGDQNSLVAILKRIAADPSLILSKKERCIDEANRYRIDQAIQILIQKLK